VQAIQETCDGQKLGAPIGHIQLSVAFDPVLLPGTASIAHFDGFYREYLLAKSEARPHVAARRGP
jgi:hypothetical protein